MFTQKDLGLKIKEIRKAKKITQEKLAELIDVDFGYISKLEVGQNFPSIQTLSKIADVLNVDISEFFLFLDLNKININEEIRNMLEVFPKEKQVFVYKFMKSIE
jgi:transcriptional regulator with XRE-family HTH domain